MTLQWQRQTCKRCYHCRNFSDTAVAELESGLSWLCREKKTKMNRQCDLTHPSWSWTQTGRWILRSRPLCEPAHGKHRRWGGWGPWCRCSLMRFLWCGSFFHSGPTAGQEKKKKEHNTTYSEAAFALTVQQKQNLSHRPSPSRSTWPHTPEWPRWLFPVAARPGKWCVLWYPWPGWKSLERELVRRSKKEETEEKKYV